MRKRTFRTAMSFDKATMTLGNAGVSGAMLPNDTDSVRKALDGFSWFGSSANTNNYWDDVTAQNIIPKPEDFIRVPFRLLSATIVGAGTWKATDFTDAVLLKESTQKLDKKTIFFDHEQDIMNWVGIVTEPTWSEARVQGNMTIPAGIDGILNIDAKTNPKLARGVLSGAVFSNSVTVVFDWVMSHASMSTDDFYNKMGTVVDGKMVCRRVTKIYDYYETSLCWLGADPYAKLYDDKGNLRQVDSTAVFVDEPDEVKSRYTKDGAYSVAFGYSKNVFNSLSKQKYNFNQSKEEKMDKELQAFLLVMFGLPEGTELDFAKVKAEFEKKVVLSKSDKDALDANKAVAEKVAALAKASLGKDCEDMSAFLEGHAFVEASLDIVGLQTAQSTLTSVTEELKLKEGDNVLETVQSLSKDAEIGRKSLSAKREETKRLYGLSVQNKTNDSVLGMIAKATPEELDGLLNMYTKGVQDSFKGTCKKCGSSEFTFRSTKADDGGEGNDNTSTAEGMSFDDIYAAESKGNLFIAKN